MVDTDTARSTRNGKNIRSNCSNRTGDPAYRAIRVVRARVRVVRVYR